MKARMGPIVKQIWLCSHYLSCFAILSTQQITTWANKGPSSPYTKELFGLRFCIFHSISISLSYSLSLSLSLFLSLKYIDVEPHISLNVTLSLKWRQLSQTNRRQRVNVWLDQILANKTLTKAETWGTFVGQADQGFASRPGWQELDRVVASNIRDLQFKSCHWQVLVYCYWGDKNQRGRLEMAN